MCAEAAGLGSEAALCCPCLITSHFIENIHLDEDWVISVCVQGFGVTIIRFVMKNSVKYLHCLLSERGCRQSMCLLLQRVMLL